jgi:hypothetical protein
VGGLGRSGPGGGGNPRGGPDGGGTGGLGGGTRNSSTRRPCCSVNSGSRKECGGREWIWGNWGRGEGVAGISSVCDFRFGLGSVWLDRIDANGATWLRRLGPAQSTPTLSIFREILRYVDRCGLYISLNSFSLYIIFLYSRIATIINSVVLFKHLSFCFARLSWISVSNRLKPLLFLILKYATYHLRT